MRTFTRPARRVGLVLIINVYLHVRQTANLVDPNDPQLLLYTIGMRAYTGGRSSLNDIPRPQQENILKCDPTK